MDANCSCFSCMEPLQKLRAAQGPMFHSAFRTVPKRWFARRRFRLDSFAWHAVQNWIEPRRFGLLKKLSPARQLRLHHGGGFWILHLASPGHRSDPGGRSARVVVTGSPAFHGGKDKGTSSGVPEQVRVCETPEEIVIEIEIVCTNGHTATSIGQV